ncbi:hypothetical protein JTB14_001652 [Gonioctena quinquepunctata]|nr:hypothetical protein JTB14_001652 [Gonioctena quinquepunctata]
MNMQHNTESAIRKRSPEEISKLSMYLVENNPFSEEENKEFVTFYPELADVLSNFEPWCSIPKVKEWINEALDYNVLYGTKARGIATVLAYRTFEKSENLSQENIKLAYLLGWCCRLKPIADDIVDNGKMRYGRSSFYLNEHVGRNRAIVDSIYIKSGINHVLKLYFSNHPQYIRLVDLFAEVNLKFYLGQILELMPQNLKEYTYDYYRMTSIGKSEYCMFFHPVAAAMLLANISDEQLHRKAKDVLLNMGHYYQMQSDFYDCFGAADQLGTIGTDMTEGKCTWPVVKALEKANPKQKKMIEEHYGRDEDESVRIMLNIYDELNLKEEFKRCEGEIYKEIRFRISRLPKELSHDLFYTLLDKLYDRKRTA